MKKTTADVFAPTATINTVPRKFDLVYAPMTLATLKAAIDSGADRIRLNCDSFSPISHSSDASPNIANLDKGIRYAHEHQREVVVALETDAAGSDWTGYRHLIDRLVGGHGIHTLILNDPSLMFYTTITYPHVAIHLSTDSSTVTAASLHLYERQFGIKRIVMPRVLSLRTLQELAAHTALEIEVIGFGKSCAITSSQAASPAGAFKKVKHIGQLSEAEEHADDARYGNAADASNDVYYAIEAAPDLNALRLLPELARAGIGGFLVEGFGRDACYTAQVIRVWREAIDQCFSGIHRFSVKPSWIAQLNKTTKMRRAG